MSVPKGAFKTLLANYKIKAKKSGRTWALSDEQFFSLTKGNCHYCDLAPTQKVWMKNPALTYTYNGVDRTDNSKGYSSGNCVSCCGACNSLKGAKITYTQMVLIGKVLKFLRETLKETPNPEA